MWNYLLRRIEGAALFNHLQTFTRKMPEDGHVRWSKRAAVLAVITKLQRCVFVMSSLITKWFVWLHCSQSLGLSLVNHFFYNFAQVDAWGSPYIFNHYMTAAILDFSARGHRLWVACHGYMTSQFESKSDLFFIKHPVSGAVRLASSDSTMNEYCIRRDVRGSGPGLIWAAVPVFVWRDGGNPLKKMSLWPVSKIRTQVLQSTKEKRNTF